MVKLSSLDLFRKVPKDLTQATGRGGFLSIAVTALLALVLTFETWTYISGETRSKIVLDNNNESLLDINFEVSFFELPCRFANVEVWDYLGNAKLDVSTKIQKTVISGADGEIHVGEYLHKPIPHPGKAAVRAKPAQPSDRVTDVPTKEVGALLKENEYTFVLYYVQWCMFCQMVLPIWQQLGAHIATVRPNVKITQINCVTDAALCRASKISGYPTFMMFQDVHPLEQEYHGPRSVAAFTDYITRVTDKAPEDHSLKLQWHEGCLLRGTLKVNRVPGNFHVSAKSDVHNFDQKSTNTSHIVHHISFGDRMGSNLLSKVPEDVRRNIAPLDGQVFVNKFGHMSHEHYIKVVSTHYEVGTLLGHSQILGYQMATSNHQYRADPNVPEARFSFDLSPTAVVISQAGRRWYEFLTSLCAIIGGTFTSFALMDGVFHSIQRRLQPPTTPSSKLT